MENYLDDYDVESARRIDLLMRRIPGDHGAAFDLARARLLSASRDDAAAEELYGRLAKHDLPKSQDALLRLFEARVARNAPVTERLAHALQDAAFIARGGPKGRQLLIASVRALALSSGLPEALRMVKEGVARNPSDQIAFLDAGHAALEEASARETGALDYLKAVTGYRELISRDVAGDAARRRVADELTSVGLANAGLEILEPATGRGSPPVRRAEARALLSLDRAEEALAALDGVRGVEASRLRARADEMLGKPEQALARLTKAGGPAEENGDLALMAGDWRRAAESGPEPRRLLAAWMAGDAPEDASGDAPAKTEEAEAFLDPPEVGETVTLRDAKAVMNSSRAVREIINEALKDG